MQLGNAGMQARLIRSENPESGFVEVGDTNPHITQKMRLIVRSVQYSSAAAALRLPRQNNACWTYVGVTSKSAVRCCVQQRMNACIYDAEKKFFATSRIFTVGID